MKVRHSKAFITEREFSARHHGSNPQVQSILSFLNHNDYTMKYKQGLHMAAAGPITLW